MKESRQQKILNLLKTKKDMSTEDLAFRFSVTTQTIRRDLEDLEKMGLVVKMYGGAALVNPNDDHRSFATFFNDTENYEAKEKIAEAAFNLVEDGNTLAMDAGSTTRLFGRHLRKKNNLTIITRDVILATYLAGHPTNRVYLLGGFVGNNLRTESSGDEAFIESISQMDFFFFSSGGINMENGFTSNLPTHEDYRSNMIPKAKTRIALMDSSKFGATCLYRSCDLTDANIIITDSGVDKKIAGDISALGIDLTIAK